MKEILKMKADLFLWQHKRHQAFCGYTVGVTRVKGVYTAYVTVLCQSSKFTRNKEILRVGNNN